MKELILNNKKYLLVEVPEKSKLHHFYGNRLIWTIPYTEWKDEQPPIIDNHQVISLLKDLTEEQAKEILGDTTWKDHGVDETRNYLILKEI